MRKKVLKGIIPIFILFLSNVACANSIATLPNGKKVEVIKAIKMYFTESDPAFIFKYETKIEVNGDNRKELIQEAEEVWPIFYPIAEVSDLNQAIIQANNTSKSLLSVSTSKTFGVMFRKNQNGKWVRTTKI
ncbi:hypothetical protein [Photobacterium sanguinicancri]|uniref:hypothetical protein n=1 Tax=Photobacterium sanguinicancri TaxID=875932 RepID=UPI00247FCC0C|nr:hypothetical protein [Photobacterium sanguinicancri]